VRLLLVALLLASCDGDAPPAPPPQPSTRWQSFDVPGLGLFLPEGWTAGPDAGSRGVVFHGPAEEGFRTSVIVNRTPWDRGAEEWRRFYADKFEDPEARLWRIVDRGSGTVAGVPATLLVYEETKAPVVTMDWYFWRDGHGYILRCAARLPTFARYRPVFEEIARRLRPARA
jgi:hypothetical protein